jgi:hypothetical protein
MKVEYIYDEKTTASIEMLEKAYAEIQNCVKASNKYGLDIGNRNSIVTELDIINNKLIKIKEVAIPIGIEVIDERDGYIIYTERLKDG